MRLEYTKTLSISNKTAYNPYDDSWRNFILMHSWVINFIL